MVASYGSLDDRGGMSKRDHYLAAARTSSEGLAPTDGVQSNSGSSSDHLRG